MSYVIIDINEETTMLSHIIDKTIYTCQISILIHHPILSIAIWIRTILVRDIDSIDMKRMLSIIRDYMRRTLIIIDTIDRYRYFIHFLKGHLFFKGRFLKGAIDIDIMHNHHNMHTRVISITYQYLPHREKIPIVSWYCFDQYRYAIDIINAIDIRHHDDHMNVYRKLSMDMHAYQYTSISIVRRCLRSPLYCTHSISIIASLGFDSAESCISPAAELPTATLL